MPYTFAPAFKRRFSRKTPERRAAILSTIHQVDKDPRYPGLHTHRVRGTVGVWEAYVNSGDRITFHYENGIVFRMNCNHDEVLRNP